MSRNDAPMPEPKQPESDDFSIVETARMDSRWLRELGHTWIATTIDGLLAELARAEQTWRSRIADKIAAEPGRLWHGEPVGVTDKAIASALRLAESIARGTSNPDSHEWLGTDR